MVVIANIVKIWKGGLEADQEEWWRRWERICGIERRSSRCEDDDADGDDDDDDDNGNDGVAADDGDDDNDCDKEEYFCWRID